jgi:hypothetical protein
MIYIVASIAAYVIAITVLWYSFKRSKKESAEKLEVLRVAEEERKHSTAPIDYERLRELVLKPESEEMKLERMKAYIQRPTQKLLRSLMEKGKPSEIVPIYDPTVGFRYQAAEAALDGKASTLEVEELLGRLNYLGILSKDFHETVSACPVCSATALTMHYRCPKCGSHHVAKTSLTEHIPCGHIDEKEKYYSAGWTASCPKCGASLVEGQYRDMGLWYSCRECREKFEHPQLNLVCRKCENEFSLQTATIREISKYTLSPDKEQEIRQNVTSLESIENLLVELGFSVEIAATAIGEKSGIEHNFSLIASKKVGERAKLVAIDHAVATAEVGTPPLILFTFKISEVKVDLPIFVAIPKLTETAKRIAQGYNVLVIEGLPRQKEELAVLYSEIQRRLKETPTIRKEDKKPTRPEPTRTEL